MTESLPPPSSSSADNKTQFHAGKEGVSAHAPEEGKGSSPRKVAQTVWKQVEGSISIQPGAPLSRLSEGFAAKFKKCSEKEQNSWFHKHMTKLTNLVFNIQSGALRDLSGVGGLFSKSPSERWFSALMATEPYEAKQLNPEMFARALKKMSPQQARAVFKNTPGLYAMWQVIQQAEQFSEKMGNKDRSALLLNLWYPDYLEDKSSQMVVDVANPTQRINPQYVKGGPFHPDRSEPLKNVWIGAWGQEGGRDVAFIVDNPVLDHIVSAKTKFSEISQPQFKAVFQHWMNGAESLQRTLGREQIFQFLCRDERKEGVSNNPHEYESGAAYCAALMKNYEMDFETAWKATLEGRARAFHGEGGKIPENLLPTLALFEAYLKDGERWGTETMDAWAVLK